jgi:hypothetical protein
MHDDLPTESFTVDIIGCQPILLHDSAESVFSDENTCLWNVRIVTRKPYPNQTGFVALNASDVYMKHAKWANKSVQFAEERKRGREKSQATEIKFCVNHLSHPYWSVNPLIPPERWINIMLFKVQTISHLKPVIVIKDHYIFH